MNIKKASITRLWSVLAVLTAFCIGYVHLRWFFPFYFDGDAAAMHILAKAMLAEKSLLPADFSYGNQIILFRSSPFIALAMLAGATGYHAFLLGSSLSVAFWGVVLHRFLSVWFKSGGKGLLYTALLLLPLGFWDVDYILGQQSHLSNAVLALGFVISVQLHLVERRHLLLGCLCLLLISLEAPIRGLLIIVPLLVVFAAVARPAHLIETTLAVAGTMILALAINKILIGYRPIALNYFHTLTFKEGSEVLKNLLNAAGDALNGVGSINAVRGKPPTIPALLIFTGGLLLIFANIAGVIAGLRATAGQGMVRLNGHDRQPDAQSKLILQTGAVGVVIGAMAVSALNPDSSRHYLWAMFLIKASVFIALGDAVARLAGKKWLAPIMLATGLLLSNWFALLAIHGWDADKIKNNTISAEEIRQIKQTVQSTGIRHLYGEDFWRMMPLNTLLDDANAQTLLLVDGEVLPHAWLTRPSWACPAGDVLYYLKDGPVDQAIQSRLEKAGGRKIHAGTGYALWQGPRVWQPAVGASCNATMLIREGESLARLPANTGTQAGQAKQTNGTAGYLAYGPYAPLKAGNYLLNVYGGAESASQAYLEVVSHQGATQYARLSLNPATGGRLIGNAPIRLPADAADIEIRLWVGAKDSVRLDGYSLIRR